MKIQKIEKQNICDISVGDIIVIENKNKESYLTIFKGSREIGGYYLLNIIGNCVIEKFSLLMQVHGYLEENYKVIKIIQEDRAILSLKED